MKPRCRKMTGLFFPREPFPRSPRDYQGFRVRTGIMGTATGCQFRSPLNRDPPHVRKMSPLSLIRLTFLCTGFDGFTVIFHSHPSECDQNKGRDKNHKCVTSPTALSGLVSWNDFVHRLTFLSSQNRPSLNSFRPKGSRQVDGGVSFRQKFVHLSDRKHVSPV